MGEHWDWGALAEHRAASVRRTALADRVQVAPPPAAAQQFTMVGPRHWVPQTWYQGLNRTEKMVVRGVVVSQESRKAVLVGRWAARQFGMWTPPEKDYLVQCALPSGHIPAKSSRPWNTEFHAIQIPRHDTVELDGVRATHPLRTLVDLCRFGDTAGAHLAASWILHAGLDRDEMTAYIDAFDSPIRPAHLNKARHVAAHSMDLGSYPYNLASALLRKAGLPVSAYAELDYWETVPLLVGNDLIIAVDEDPYHRDVVDNTGERSELLSRSLRTKSRWIAARGYRVLYFSSDEIEANPEQFIDEIFGARHLRRRDLAF